MAFWSLQDLKQAGIEPPYASVGFRDARGRVYYCVGGLRGWWLRRRATH